MPILVLNPANGGGGVVITGADNGVAINAGVIELGTNPLNQITDIFAAGFRFQINDAVSGFASRAIALILNQSSGLIEVISRHDISATHVDKAGVFDYIDSVGFPYTVWGYDNENPTAPSNIYQGLVTKNADVGLGKGIQVIDDIDQAGMGYKTDTSVQGIIVFGQRYIPDVGWIQANTLTKTSFHAVTIAATQVIETFATDATHEGGYRISCYLFAAITGAGSAKLSVTYTDQSFTVQTVDMGIALTATGNATYPPLVVLCQVNTNIIITATIIAGGGVNASAGGAIEPLVLY